MSTYRIAEVADLVGVPATTLTSEREATPIACSLDPDAAYARIDEWRRLMAKAVARTSVEGGIALQLPADPDTAAELGRRAAAEQQCCLFFDFRLHLGGPVIDVEVRAPAEAGDVVTALFGA